MTKFVELMDAKSDAVVFVNPDLVVSIQNDPNNEDIVRLLVDEDWTIRVLGTADRIAELLNADRT